MSVGGYNPQTKFLAQYYHRGRWFATEFYAEDWADAEVICKAHSFKLDGEWVATIPAATGSWLPNLIIKIRNAWKSAHKV